MKDCYICTDYGYKINRDGYTLCKQHYKEVRDLEQQKDKLLVLYSEDFGYSKLWEDICDSLGVDYNKADKVTISYNKVIINK